MAVTTHYNGSQAPTHQYFPCHTEVQTNCLLNCLWNGVLQLSVKRICFFPWNRFSSTFLHSLTSWVEISSALPVICHFCFCHSNKNKNSSGTGFCSVPCSAGEPRDTPHFLDWIIPLRSWYFEEHKYDQTHYPEYRKACEILLSLWNTLELNSSGTHFRCGWMPSCCCVKALFKDLPGVALLLPSFHLLFRGNVP